MGSLTKLLPSQLLASPLPTLSPSKPSLEHKSNPKTSSVTLLTGLWELLMMLLTGVRELSMMLLTGLRELSLMPPTGLNRPSLMLEIGQLELSLMHMTGLRMVITGKLSVRHFSELPSLVSVVTGIYSPTQACTMEKLTTTLKRKRRLLSRHKKI